MNKDIYVKRFNFSFSKKIANIVPINGAVIFNVVNSGSLICSSVIKAIKGKGIFKKPLKIGGK